MYERVHEKCILVLAHSGFRMNIKNTMRDPTLKVCPSGKSAFGIVGFGRGARVIRNPWFLTAVENSSSRGLDLRNFQFLMALKTVPFLTCSGSDPSLKRQE